MRFLVQGSATPFFRGMNHGGILVDDRTDASRVRMTQTKASLLTHGVMVEPSAAHALWHGGYKVPRMVRSGMSGGLDFYLQSVDRRIAVSCAYAVRDPEPGELTITYDGDFILVRANGERLGVVEFFPEPSYYHRTTTSGLNMASVAQQCFTKLAVGAFGSCAFDARPETTCAFCAIHEAAPTDARRKTDADILETADAVLNSELNPVIQTVMLGGGTPASADRGAVRFASLAAGLVRRVPWRITVMMAPPATDADLHRLRDGGVSEVSINLEFGSSDAFERLIPGKARLIGRARYLECLEAAVEVFGDGNVQSLLVTGLEPAEETLRAVEWLAERKIIPVLSPFRPLSGAPLAALPSPGVEEVLDVYWAARAIAEEHGMFLGPRCAPCQGNTMSLPWDIPGWAS